MPLHCRSPDPRHVSYLCLYPSLALPMRRASLPFPPPLPLPPPLRCRCHCRPHCHFHRCRCHFRRRQTAYPIQNQSCPTRSGLREISGGAVRPCRFARPGEPFGERVNIEFSSADGSYDANLSIELGYVGRKDQWCRSRVGCARRLKPFAGTGTR